MQIVITDFENKLTGRKIVFRGAAMLVGELIRNSRCDQCGKRCDHYYINTRTNNSPKYIRPACQILELGSWQ